MIDQSRLQAASTRCLAIRMLRVCIMPHWRLLGVASILTVLAAPATSAQAWIIQPVMDDIFLHQDIAKLTILPLVLIIIGIVKSCLDYIATFLTGKIGAHLNADLHKRVFAKTLSNDLAFFHRQPSGHILSVFAHDIERLNANIVVIFSALVKDSTMLFFLVSLMVYQDAYLSIMIFALLPISFLPILRIGRWARNIATQQQALYGRFIAFLDKVIKGIRDVKAFQMEASEQKIMAQYASDILRLRVKNVRRVALSSPLMEFFGTGSLAVTIWYGGSQVIDGALTPGQFFSFMTALLLAYRPCKSLAHLNVTLQIALAAAQKVFAFLDAPTDLKNKQGERNLPTTDGPIVLDKVTFSYDGVSNVLHNVSLEIKARSVTALVGPSGSGKSTIFHLISRFYDPNHGQITIHGHDLRTINTASLRRHISLVSQDIFLFDGTIRDNISYGHPRATLASIRSAAKKAYADSFIRKLPKGYNTRVGENGVRLSGGQRQRIAIARAFLHDAPLILMDEATSSLDPIAEKHIQKALASLRQGRTCIIIAHRLSTVQNADCIVVCDKGLVVDQGNHHYLLDHSVLYQALYAQGLPKMDLEMHGS